MVHYNPELPLRLAGDASAYGIGAVISHLMPDGSERPVAFASRTLSASEKNYSQIEKADLIFGVRKFQYYLWEAIHIDYRSQTLAVYFGPKERRSSHGSCQVAAMGCFACGISVPGGVLAHGRTWKR